MATKPRKPTAEGERILEELQGMSDEDFEELARRRKGGKKTDADGDEVFVLRGKTARSFLDRLGITSDTDEELDPDAELEEDPDAELEEDPDGTDAHPAGKKRDPAPPQRHRYFG